MSAFLVSYGTIDDTVDAFREIERGPCDADALGRALLALNAEAMRQRYPQILTERLECGRTEYAACLDAARAYTCRPGHKDPRQRAKSAACLAYQCAEGDVPETPLGKRLDAVETAMAAAHPWRREEEWVSATGDRFVRVFSDGLIWHRDRSEGPRMVAGCGARGGPRHADPGPCADRLRGLRGTRDGLDRLPASWLPRLSDRDLRHADRLVSAA
jgi:hypothetical protein